MGIVSWLRNQTLHSPRKIAGQPESTQKTGVETAAQNFLRCPQTLRRLGLRQSRETGCEVEGAQEVGGGAVPRGDRCVAELTTLLHRIEGRS